MDSYSNINVLHESKNEWTARLITILAPLIVDGYKSILEEAIKLCKENNEMDKYLMTFQNFVSRIPKWNPTIIETERKRICEKSGCNYLEDLVTCVHVVQLKILTSMRAGQKQKKIDINVPNLDDFIHRIYINVARKVYKNVYLFETMIPPLQVQKHNRELDVIVQECIMNTVRESIPVEAILKLYMSAEDDCIVDVKEEYLDETNNSVEPPQNTAIPGTVTATAATTSATTSATTATSATTTSATTATSVPETSTTHSLGFSDVDYVKDSDNNVHEVVAPKTIEELEIKRKQRENANNDDGDSDDRIKISWDEEAPSLDGTIETIGGEVSVDMPDLLMDEIEVLD
jgi:hypothetical protein